MESIDIPNSEEIVISFIIGHRYGKGIAKAISEIKMLEPPRIRIGKIACIHPRAAVITGNYSDPRSELTKNKIGYVMFNDVNDNSVIAALKKDKPSFIFVSGLKQILKKEILEIPKITSHDQSLYSKNHGIICFHPGELPSRAGASPIQWTILDELSEITVTAFYIDGISIDNGPIIDSTPIPITSNVDAEELDNLVTIAISRIIVKLIKKSTNGLSYEHQNKLKNYTYIHKKQLKQYNYWLDFERDSKSLVRLVRACTIPYPMAYFFYFGSLVRVKWAKELDFSLGAPGQILDFSDETITIKCGEGAILLYGLIFTKPLSCSVGDIIY